MAISIFLFISLLINGTFMNIITSHYALYNNIPTIGIKLSPSNLTYMTYLSTSFSISRFPYDLYGVINYSNVIQQLTIPEYYYSIQYQDKLKLNNDNEIDNYNFYIVKFYDHYKSFLGLALAYKFEDEKFSIIDKLFKTNQIFHKQFAFSQQSIHFGGVPDNYHLTMKYKGQCNVVDNYSTWGCILSKMRYKGKEIALNSYSSFHSSADIAFESKQFFEFMKNEVFKEHLKSNDCDLLINEYWNNRIECKKELINTFGNIELIFGNLVIAIPISKLFKDLNTFSISLFYFKDTPSFKINTDKTIIIGFAFLHMFNYSVFDYEEKKIGFYSDIIEMKDELYYINSSKTIKFLIISITILCLSKTILLLFMKNKCI